jgi:hypothetical protein
MGFKLTSDTPAMEREIMCLLDDLCVKWGFCIPPTNVERICRMSHLTAKTFATGVVEAEEMNPEYEHRWVRKIAAKFRERFGSEEISNATFVDRVWNHKESW